MELELDTRKKIYFWFLTFENYKNNLNSYKKIKGPLFLFYFLAENLFFVLLSIIFYFIKLNILIFQVNNFFRLHSFEK